MSRVVPSGGLAAALLCVFASIASSQTASLTGYIKDQTGAVVPDVSVELTSETTGFKRQVRSNDDGLYALVELPPDRYTLLIEQAGFQRVLRPNLALDVASSRRIDVVLSVGALEDTVRVSAPTRDVTHDTTGMGTLIRPDEVEHLPIAGRSVQKLVAMAPGTIPTSASSSVGEFSVHGQRASANHLSIDGVSGNVSTEVAPAAGSTIWGNGTLPGYSPSGSSSNLFSLDAVEEVRIQTSSYAPEYGRMPGAQISVITKSGTSKFAGSAYEYFRDDALDATDFFVNNRGLAKPAMRFNTFGGTLGGPLLGRSLFFFGNYEGQRLTLPRFSTTGVPTQATRDRTSGGLRMLLDAFPLPNGRDLGSGMAEFAMAVSDRTHANVGAFRIDYTPGSWRLFGRVHVGDTETAARGVSSAALSQVQSTTGRTVTTTAGANIVAAGRWLVEARFNYTTNSFEGSPAFDAVNGARALSPEAVGVAGISDLAGSFSIISGLGGNSISFGRGLGRSNQRQINAIVSATTVAAAHSLKVGMDVRRLFPTSDIPDARISYNLGNPTALQGDLIGRVTVGQDAPADVVLLNYSLFAQDQWQVNERLALTYGLRWDINPAPRTNDARQPYLVEDAHDPALMRERPSSAALWRTDYTGIAPRLAATYRLGGARRYEQILRAGGGLFYDMGWAGATAAFGRGFPFNSSRALVNVRLPLDASTLPPLPLPGAQPGASDVYAFPDDPSLPRSTQWHAGYEFAGGGWFSAAATYLGARGHGLTRQVRYDYSSLPGSPYARITSVEGNGRSEYNALEMRLRVRPTNLVDGEASYTLARSEDNASDDVAIGLPASRANPAASWGPSSFDARHTVKWRLGTTTPSARGFWRAFGDTSIYLSAFYQSALPGSPEYTRDLGFGTYIVRADVVPGVPVYLDDASVPGGRRINLAAFAVPTEARQGTAGRNSVRFFPLSQVDLAVKRRVPVWSGLRLDVGVDVFNLFNRPQFARPFLFVTSPGTFGVSMQSAANDLGTGANGRGLSPIFQPGGPRSVQLVVRATF